MEKQLVRGEVFQTFGSLLIQRQFLHLCSLTTGVQEEHLDIWRLIDKATVSLFACFDNASAKRMIRSWVVCW